MFVSEIYELEDCIIGLAQNQIDHTTDVTYDYSLPTNFKLEFGLTATSNSGTSIGLLRFNSSSGVWCGKGGSGSSSIYFNGAVLHNISFNTPSDYVLRYENGVGTFSIGETSISQTVSLTKFYSYASRGNTKINYIKIKPL